MKIGVMLESFRLPLNQALQAAADVGADGLQLYAVRGETRFDQLLGTQAGRDLQQRAADLGLEFAAICGDFGHGFGDAEQNPGLIENSKRVVDLALEQGSTVVTTHIGVVPHGATGIDREHPRYGVMRDACGELAEYGRQHDVTFAVETGPEPAAVLRQFLDDIGGGIGANFDPANLAMVIAEDLPSAVASLGPYIVHTHAKDGVQLKACNPEDLYGGKLSFGEHVREVPLGQGAVPWPTYLDALRQAGFDGFLTIEREVGETPRADIEQAVVFLREQLA